MLNPLYWNGKCVPNVDERPDSTKGGVGNQQGSLYETFSPHTPTRLPGSFLGGVFLKKSGRMKGDGAFRFSFLAFSFFMRTEHSPFLDALRRQLFRLLFLKYCLVFAGIHLFSWGTAVLVLRVLNWVPWTQLWWGGLGLLLVPVFANFLARAKLPKSQTLFATMDRENSAGGLIVSSLETDLGEWNAAIPQLVLPVFRWDGRKTGLMTLLSVLFVLLAFLLPDSTIVAEFHRPLNIEDRVNKLQGQLETLKEENILDLEKVEAMQLNLERIQKDAEGLGPDKTLDALRHLEDQVQQKADEAAEQGLQETETLSKAEALVEQTQKFADGLSQEETDSLMQSLAEMLTEMFDDDSDLFEKLARLDSGDSEDWKEMLQNKKLDNLSKELLEQLRQAMKEGKECNREMLQKLLERGMLDPKMLDQFEELEKIDEEALQRLLDELGWGNCGGCEGEGCEGRCLRPGRGGISRGRGDAPITFDNEEASEEGTGFQSQVLPPAALEELKNSLKFGSSVASPELNSGGSPSDQGGALQSRGEGTGSAHGQTILPQHRGPIGRYFERSSRQP